MTPVQFAVYAPPRPELPFLAVEILADGSVAATPYESQAEAEAHESLAARSVKAGPDDEGSSTLGALLP